MEIKIAQIVFSLAAVLAALLFGYGTFVAAADGPPLNAPKVLDISEASGALDTDAMQTEHVSAVIVRASHGQTQDGQAIANVAQLRAAGIPIAALYHEYDPALPWVVQYETLTAVMAETGIDRAAVYLVETAGWTPAVAADVQAFLAALADAHPLPITYRHIIYTDAATWQALGSPAWGAGYELWIAEWTGAVNPTPLAPWKTWRLWQYTAEGDGPANGVEAEYVGISRFNGSSLQFESWLRMTMVRGAPMPRPGGA